MKETSRHPGSVQTVVLRASIREILSTWHWLSVTQWASSDRDWETEARGGKAPRHGLRGCAPRALPWCVSDKPPAPPMEAAPRAANFYLLKPRGRGAAAVEPTPWRDSGDAPASCSSSPTGSGFSPAAPELSSIHFLHEREFSVPVLTRAPRAWGEWDGAPAAGSGTPSPRSGWCDHAHTHVYTHVNAHAPMCAHVRTDIQPHMCSHTHVNIAVHTHSHW